MKAIKIGNHYEIYDDSLETFDSLPARVYTVRFSKMTGFFLEEHSDLNIDEKIYGVHLNKVDKVLSAFTQFQRSLGVILSGDKGIGKSLFAKLLCIRAVKENLPVVIVDKFVPGISAYIESIEQEAVILFDEFDKTFGSVKTGEGEADPQAGMLSLFDGMAQGKKLFVITCNELHHLNDYLVNRPGRFHYHFRFEYPSAEEVVEYLHDKLDEKYYGEIDKVVSFSRKVNLNYDCLRAIAFELSTGESFESAITDLNIINTRNERYNVVLRYNDGTTLTAKDINIDLFDPTSEANFWMRDSRGCFIVEAAFSASDCVFDNARCVTMVDLEGLKLDYDDDEGAAMELKKRAKPEYMTITRVRNRDIHYMA